MSDESRSISQSAGEFAMFDEDDWRDALASAPISSGLRAALAAPSEVSRALRDAGWRGPLPSGAAAARAAIVDAPWESISAAVRAEAGAIDLRWGEDAAVAAAVRAAAGDLTFADDEREALAAALSAEAGEVDLAGAVLAELGFASAPLAEALGQPPDVDVADGVFAALGLAGAGGWLAEALDDEAGRVDLAEAVLAEVAPGAAPRLGEAVVDESGSVDLWAKIAGDLSLHPVLAEPVLVPAAANRARPARGWIAAAAALAAVFLGWVSVPSPDVGAPSPAPANVEFAQAGEFVVDDLHYASEASVSVMMSDDGGAQIIWVDEGV